MSDVVVSNSSPLIALDQIGRLDLAQNLFNQLIVPPAVVQEVSPQVALPHWIVEETLTQPLASQVLAVSLGPGEREAICLAYERNAARLIVDDLPARRLAAALGIPIIGTLGVLVAAKRHGLIPDVRSLLDSLIQHGFYMTPSLYGRVLTQVGESA
jgi:predicted nucleic acid-binding protein